MKKLFLSIVLVCAAFMARGAAPAFWDFNINHFLTNGSPWEIALSTNINNQLGFHFFQNNEYWYDPFSGSALSAGTVGQLGWVPVGSPAVSNAVGHFGTLALTTTASAGNGSYCFLSTTTNTRPCIPPLHTEINWTNRIIWRVNGTNAAKVYLVLQNGIWGQTLFADAIGLWMNTTNNNQILGVCSSSSSVSTTNLGNLVDNAWYTNEIWSTTAGTIAFSLNGGAAAHLSANVPTVALTPLMGALKPTATAAVSLEIDKWILIRSLY